MEYKETQNQVRGEIIDKFLTIKNFCSATQRSLPALNNFLRSSESPQNIEKLKLIQQEVKQLSSPQKKPTQALGNKIKKAILAQSNSLRGFQIKNPQFSYKLIDDLVHARPRKLSINGELLCKKLNIQI